MIACLRSNPNYDILSMGSVRANMEQINHYATTLVWRDLQAITNLYPPLRLHPMTRGAVNNIITRYKKLALVPN